MDRGPYMTKPRTVSRRGLISGNVLNGIRTRAREGFGCKGPQRMALVDTPRLSRRPDGLGPGYSAEIDGDARITAQQ